ncbi:MAG: hypothetical protein RSC62_03015 [Cetobacterium sp.]|uniref:hypothetical protein n=1 Tax=Cetobacterium sp. TaxID=2071632 RepID=UPI002FC7A2FD
MIKKVLVGTLALSSLGFAADLSTVSGETTAVFAKQELSNDKPLIYLADNFHEMATVPGFSMGAPSGLVSSYGVAFAGLSGKTNSDDTDGALALGMGFGDAETIGGAISLGVGSIDPRDGGAFNRGNLNMSLGHHFKDYGFGWSVGMNGVNLWHDNGDDGDNENPSFYTAVTKLWPNDIAPIAITAGLGNNSFADVNIENRDRKEEVGGFGSVAVYLFPQMSLILDYTSNVVTVGTSIVPFPQYPVSINLGATNLTEQGPEDKVSAIGSIAAAYVF